MKVCVFVASRLLELKFSVEAEYRRTVQKLLDCSFKALLSQVQAVATRSPTNRRRGVSE